MKIFVFFKDVIIKKYPKEFLSTVLLLLLMVVFDTAAVLILAPFVDLITKPDLVGVSPITLRILSLLKQVHLPANVYGIMGVMLVIAILKAGSNLLIFGSILRTKYVLIKDLICDTFRVFFDARWSFFTTNRQGVLGNTFIKETSKIGDSFAFISMILVKAAQAVLYFGIAFVISWQLSLIILLISVFFLLPFSMMGKLTYKLGRANVATANRIYEIIQENLSAAKLAIGYDEQKKGIRSLSQAIDESNAVTVKAQVVENGTAFLFQPVGMAIVFLAFLLSGVLIKISMAELTVILFSFYSAMPLVGQMVTAKNSFLGFFPAYEQINNLRSIANNDRQPSGSIIFERIKSHIAFENVSFKYPDQEQLLYKINLIIPRGKMIALVGKSGAGKSTIVDLIMRFYEPDSGSVLIDGLDLKELDVHSWRKKIGYVPQDSFLFNFSIKDNLLWANEDASEAQIKRACRMANVDEFLSDLPAGLDTIVGDRGVRLSGGQRQRIALARAILREPEILILDEATSSLDSHSEKLIQESIENISKETTIIVVAHRLSTIINASCIYVLHEGVIEEEGNYHELCARKGKYYELAKNQSLV